MYNRYIPTENGGYIRQKVEETPPFCPNEPLFAQGETKGQESPPTPKKDPLGFLKRLLPQGLDTGDLLVLIVVLLLLLDKEENEDLLPVLITTAAYLFLK